MRSAPYDPQRERVRVTHSAAAADEIRQAFATGAILNLAGADVPATLLVARLAGTALQADGLIPALRLAGATVRGPLELPGATVPVLVEFTSCTVDEPIDLYAANLAGWRLARCTLRGLQAASLWFAHHQPPPLDRGKDPSWQPVIYTADLLFRWRIWGSMNSGEPPVHQPGWQAS